LFSIIILRHIVACQSPGLAVPALLTAPWKQPNYLPVAFRAKPARYADAQFPSNAHFANLCSHIQRITRRRSCFVMEFSVAASRISRIASHFSSTSANGLGELMLLQTAIALPSVIGSMICPPVFG